MCRLRVHTDLESTVVVIRLCPGFDDSAIAAMIEHAPKLRGLVLGLYGTGNGPSHKDEFMRVISKAIEKDVLVVAVSQCHKGAVSLEAYEVGRRLLEIGVVSALDMTTEVGRGWAGGVMRCLTAEGEARVGAERSVGRLGMRGVLEARLARSAMRHSEAVNRTSGFSPRHPPKLIHHPSCGRPPSPKWRTFAAEGSVEMICGRWPSSPLVPPRLHLGGW